MAPDAPRNFWPKPRWSVTQLVAAKRGRTISVVLPALNEEETVATVVGSISPLLGSLVDELIVLDSGSTDSTRRLAAAAGAQVWTREEALPDLPVRPGKGEVLWRSLAVAEGDIVVFVDSDLLNPSPRFVPALVGPLLLQPDVQLVKGFYRRPLTIDGRTDAHGGGRVTQLVARPLLTGLLPDLGDILQPLGGEYAATRELLRAIPFAPGYGVEIGILIDTYRRYGMEAIAQVNLGVRTHRNRELNELAVMSRQILASTLARVGVADSGIGLSTFGHDGTRYPSDTSSLSALNRPPMSTIDTRHRGSRSFADG
ncbi:glucosyl-3-phosphoglycerate synthase [Jatrophihabitans sp. GAS493]|uniref:glucosyl-3-phosphoglycerate synthase n=1 Tax=Jatrophihabitans sp. GAS493 TaxID=1907575 RepID=UPI000BB8FC3A|nr:glucosyl-3-phosphoglycerate synthase [Jatrophihabitans sp. GAS493]SOD73227.1 glucosyl-3-phosphoglycerate synthase [Jatrophihabitans sp. GAS493]